MLHGWKPTASLISASMTLMAGAICLAAEGLPQWAYGTTSDAPPPAAPRAQAPDTTPKTLPDTTLSFTLTQIRDGFGPADWYPGDHPPMPDVVAHGRRPEVRACALCHYPNGKGRAENAPIAGFSVAYFTEQMSDFRSGNRKSADPKKANTNIMIAIAKGMTDDEIKAAAEYFGSMKWTPWIKVVETSTAPKTRVAGGLFLALSSGEKEPLGSRIIEVPENTEATETLRNPRSGFIAYVPIGSIKKGEMLTRNCGTCHGTDLGGLGPVPGLAGRSPSYLARQMYDFQQGARKGLWSDLMKPVVAKLSDVDILNIVAYSASLKP
jgi:cytochrome c553